MPSKSNGTPSLNEEVSPKVVAKKIPLIKGGDIPLIKSVAQEDRELSTN